MEVFFDMTVIERFPVYHWILEYFFGVPISKRECFIAH